MLRTSARTLARSSTRTLVAARVPAVSRQAVRGISSVQVARKWQQIDRSLSWKAGFHSSALNLADVVKVPQMAESLTEGTLRSFAYEVGDFVEQDAEIASIETDKIDVSVNAPFSGTIVEFLAQPDDTVTVGQDLIKIEKGEGGGAAKSKPEGKKEDPPAKADTKPDESLSKKADETSKAEAASSSKSSPPPASKEPAKKESKVEVKKESTKSNEKEAVEQKVQGARGETRIKMSRMRQTIAKRLKESQNTAASLTTWNEVDLTKVIEFREKYKDKVLKQHEVKLGFMSFFTMAVCKAAKDFPAVNAAIEGDNIVFRDYVDVSVAVSSEKGLTTPVIRNAESMGLLDLERSVAGLAKKARDGKLGLEDMAGGTFTISNAGGFGSLLSMPIINFPQTAILGMHAIKDRAVVVNGKVEVRKMMYLALTYDHRLIDGRDSVQFLVRVKENLEDPISMLL